MEKLYRVLVWLAGVTLVFGLFLAIVPNTPLASVANPQDVSASGTSGSLSLFLSAFVATLRQGLYFELQNVLTLLVGGVIVMAMALAWVNRRRVWFSALIVVTLLTLLWPTGVIAWQAISPPTGALTPYPITSPEGVGNFTDLVVPLIPVALALVLALTHHKPASTATPAAA